MTSGKLIPLILLLFATLFYSCVAFRYVQPTSIFNHELHEKEVVKQRMDCFSCHNVIIDEPDIAKRVELLKQTLKDSPDKRFIQGTCHKCHVDMMTKVLEAPNRCQGCHHDMDRIIPRSHNADWVRTHAISIKDAGINGVYYDGFYKDGKKAMFACSTCHDEFFCVDCHTARDFARIKMHPRTYKIAHVSAAVADPASCGTCHTTSFCSDCHRRR